MSSETPYQKLFPGNYYHIYNRGNNKETIFKEEKNYSYFLNLWKKHVSPVALTYVYNLLPNHFHFFIKTREVTELINNLRLQEETGLISFENYISKSFSNFFNAYSKSINKAYNRTGSLFQERFKRKQIEDGNYFTELIFYIHGNAQHHGLSGDFRRDKHSSYLSILSDKPTLLERQKIIDWFGGKERFINHHSAYREVLIEKKFFLEKYDDD
jgi:putative transposase